MKLKLIAGNANPKLAQEIAKKMGIELSPATIGRFSDGEIQVKDKIDSQYIVGLILPIPEEQLQDEKNIQIVDAFVNVCEKNGLPLDIYNYEGILISKKKQIKTI